MRTKLAIASFLTVGLLWVAPAGAQSHGKPITLTGVIVDTACYIGHNTMGPDHAKCAAMCARAGIPLAVLEPKSGSLYLPLGLDHKSPNDRLLPFVEKTVRIKGTVIEKGGIRGLVIQEISAAK